MPSVVQMGVDQFWQSLQLLERKARAERVRLAQDKIRLQSAWTGTKADPDQRRAEQNRNILRPLIHANSAARIDYAAMVSQFNRAVNGAAGVLRKAGLNAPNLAGPELAILVPVVAVAALGVAWAIYAKVHAETAAQSRLVDAAMSIINNPNSTADEREQAAATIANLAKNKPPGQDPFNLDAILPIAAIVAAIVLVPPILDRLPKGRRAVA